MKIEYLIIKMAFFHHLLFIKTLNNFHKIVLYLHVTIGKWVVTSLFPFSRSIIKGLIRVKFFLKCDPRRFLIISRFFDMENTMRLLKNSGRSIFFDVNPICQPVTGCARSRKIFFWISWLQIDITRLVSTTLTLYPTLQRYM